MLVVLAYVYQGPLKKWQKNLGKPKNFIAMVNFDQVDKIEIIKPGEKNVINKKDGKWSLENLKGFPADENQVKGLIDGLKASSKDELELISVNKEKKIDFLTDDSGITLNLFSEGKSLLGMTVGKNGADFNSTYISKADANETYLVKENLAALLDTPSFADNTIFKTDKSKIAKVRFQFQKNGFTIEKKDGKWISADAKKTLLKTEKVDKILQTMSDLAAVEIPEQTFKGTGLEKNNLIVEATGEGVKNLLMVGDPNKKLEYYAKKGDNDFIYLISKDQRNSLDKKVEDLK